MSMQGEPSGEPMKVAVAIADIVAGLFAANGILAALVDASEAAEGGKSRWRSWTPRSPGWPTAPGTG